MGHGISQKGFTLIELMVVLAIIGIMTALIIPEMRGTFEDSILQATAREIISVCDLAGSRAISANEPFRVQIDNASHRYAVERRSSENPGLFLPLKDVPGGAGTLDARIALEIHEAFQGQSDQASSGNSDQSDNSNSLLFYPDGTAEPREIMLQDRQGFRLALQINPITARVRIIEKKTE